MKILLIYVICFTVVGKLQSQQDDTIVFPQFSKLKKDTNTVNFLLKESEKHSSFDSNLAISNLALNLANEIRYNLGIANALEKLAVSNYLSADYEKAYFFYLKKLDLCRSDNNFANNSVLGEIYRMIGEVARANKDYQPALVYLDSAQTTFELANNDLGLSKTYNRFAAVYFELIGAHADKRVLEYLDKSNKIAKENKFNEVIANNLNLYASYYSKFGTLQEAIRTYKSALDYYSKIDYFSEKSTVYRNISSTYKRNNQIDSALNYGRLALAEAKITNVNVHLFNSSWLLYTIFVENVKNSDSALYYLNMSLEYKSLILDTEKLMSKIQSGYQRDSKIKEKEIENQISINFYQKLVFVFVLLILILVTLFIYLKSKADKKTNALIKQQKDELFNSNANKDKLFSIIAHDLRNPLGAFKSIVNLMYDDYNNFSDEERMDLIRMMKDSSDSVLTLLENLLTWAKNQSGTIPYIPEYVNLKLICDNVIDLLKTSAKNKSISLNNHIDSSFITFADLNQLSTILRNLVSNSIKFSNSGSEINIYSAYEIIDKTQLVKISIVDQGIGMDSDKINSLFSVKQNQSKNGTHGEKGTGLGMILVYDFVKINKGNIVVESAIDKGTCVNIYLPIANDDE